MSEDKRELVAAWLNIASLDLQGARVLADAERPFFDVALYHCQQAAEKALKAFLIFFDEVADRTHKNFVTLFDKVAEKTQDVGLLAERAAWVEEGFLSWLDGANFLTPFATIYPYPGEYAPADREMFDEGWDDAKALFHQVLTYLPRELHPS